MLKNKELDFNKNNYDTNFLRTKLLTKKEINKFKQNFAFFLTAFPAKEHLTVIAQIKYLEQLNQQNRLPDNDTGKKLNKDEFQAYLGKMNNCKVDK